MCVSRRNAKLHPCLECVVLLLASPLIVIFVLALVYFLYLAAFCCELRRVGGRWATSKLNKINPVLVTYCKKRCRNSAEKNDKDA